MWKLVCVLSSFLSKLISIDLSATWAALSSSTCLIPNKTSPQAVFEFFIYATEKKKNNNNNSKNNNNYKKSAFRCRYIFQMSPQFMNNKTTYPIYINLQIRIFIA